MRVLLVQPSLQPSGGGNGLAAWVLQALAARHRVTVLCWRPVDVVPIDRFFGTALHAASFEVRLVPPAWRAMARTVPVPLALLQSSLLMRYARRITNDFDMVIGTHNECDYGRRAIQYVHFPAYLRPRPGEDLRWYHGSAIALRAYYGLADAAAAVDPARLTSNLTLTNSHWTAARVAQAHGITARTVYPPVTAAGAQPRWDDRTRGFLAVGRIAPEKDYARVMRILARVRRTHPAITLTIVGTSDWRGSGLRRSLLTQAAALGPWIRFRENVSRDDLRVLMTTHRYGIHGMQREHFGMAPAEMVRAGAIVWVPDEGGQVEIVGNERLLRYGSDDEAVDAISHVLATPREEARLRAWLAVRADGFSTERFVGDIQDIVETFRA